MSSILKVDTIQDQAGNNIINESNNVITIGASGDTITSVGTFTSFRSTGIDDNADATAITIGSTEQIGIGSTGFDQDAKLTIASSGSGGSNPSSISANTIATFRRTGGTSHAANISILGGSSGASILNLGDRDDEDVGRIIYEHSSNYMAFTTGASERMRLTSTGLGIGTTSLANGEKLKVEGKVYINAPESDSIFTTGAALIFPGTYNNIRQSTNHSLHFDAYNGGSTISPLTIMQNGKIGLGTEAPAAKLHVDTSNSGVTPNANADELFVENSGNAGITIGSGTGNSGQLCFGDSGDNDIGAIAYLHDINAMRFSVNGPEKMRIDSSGNLLVGTTSAGSTTAGIKLLASNAIASVISGGTSGYFGRLSNDGDVIKIRKDSATVGVIGTQNWGIGTSSPTSPLMVQSNDVSILHLKGANDKQVMVETTGGATQITSYAIKNSAYSFQMENGRSANTFTIRASTGGERFRIDSSGNVGIGTTAPSQKLDVVGSIEVSDGIYIGGTGTANKLDDYEEGTWTPAYTGSTTTGTGVTGAGQYTKIGNLVHVDFGFVNVTTSGAAGDLRITGLPFTVSNATTRGSFAGNVRFYNHDLAGNTYYQLTPVADGNTTYIIISQTRDNGTWSVVQIDNDSGLYIEGGITYTTTS